MPPKQKATCSNHVGRTTSLPCLSNGNRSCIGAIQPLCDDEFHGISRWRVLRDDYVDLVEAYRSRRETGEQDLSGAPSDGDSRLHNRGGKSRRRCGSAVLRRIFDGAKPGRVDFNSAASGHS